MSLCLRQTYEAGFIYPFLPLTNKNTCIPEFWKFLLFYLEYEQASFKSFFHKIIENLSTHWPISSNYLESMLFSYFFKGLRV